MLIARAFPVMQVYVKKGHNKISYKGNVLTLLHNDQNVAIITMSYIPQCP